tara:strand:- start:6379 stop:6621 length:243 start_codon:yes stop_codon:yes gene_type:complete
MEDYRKVKRIADNFVKKYGVETLQDLINMISAGESGQDIADKLNVSRERVRQWKNTFGNIVIYYQLHPAITQTLIKYGEE